MISLAIFANQVLQELTLLVLEFVVGGEDGFEGFADGLGGLERLGCSGGGVPFGLGS